MEACSELGLQPVKQIRRNHLLSLLLYILQDEKRHSTILVAYDEIVADCQKVTMMAQSAVCREMAYAYAALHIDTVVASYQEPSEMQLGMQINKQNAKIV